MKTQKSFKKRALLSSIAMLLVATVAVGSATFAWFTQSPTASASGLKMKATASNGLKVISQSQKAADDGSDFSSATYLNYDSSTKISSTEAVLLNPASYTFSIDTETPENSTFNSTGYKTNALNAENSYASDDKNDGAKVSTAVANYTGTKDVYAEEVYCKLVGAATEDATTTLKLASLVVETNDVPLKNSLRVLVTYNGKIKGAYALSAVNDEVSLNGEADTYKAAKKSTVDFTTFTSVNDLTLGTLGQSGSDAVKVYVYLDGEDANCKSANINATDIVKSITLNLAIPTE